MNLAVHYCCYVESELRRAILEAFYDNEDVYIVRVRPAPWQGHVNTIIYHLGNQQRIYL